ncbi:f4d012ef-3f5c-4572-9a75-b4a44b840c6e [Thermothielavioides terrestris]|jgi:serine/threonine protein kinase|uniref:F4d012ef-3f5c-4572-9a75-b4a44b840c6e n=1 Tax=Thermothielavioides terrestris TaxID=2587410 RepID=A0A446BVI6_9PEZI|nr:f4d012ef-3f5c-4572-9a75-b4a44b840c6e [Thermothielavioides terrestris]
MSDEVSVPTNLSGLPWTCGLSGAVWFISDKAVLKRAFTDDEPSKQQLRVERQIYERLGSHPRIPALLGTQPDALILQRLQCSLRERLLEHRARNERPPTADVLRWALQTAEAMQYIHSRGVCQVDVGTYNVLLDADGNAKLSDFAGSSLDGSPPLICPSAHATHPRLSTSQPSVHSELFALGSLLYELETTYQPFHDKNDAELEALFGADEFPATDDLLLAEVVRKCWMRQYGGAGEVVADIQRVRDRVGGTVHSPAPPELVERGPGSVDTDSSARS